MAYTETFRLPPYSAGRIQIEEIYINGALAPADTIKSRLTNPKYVSIRPAPSVAAAVTPTNWPAASLSGRTATVQSANAGSISFIVRFVGN